MTTVFHKASATIGIDPGLTGALALLSDEGGVLVEDMPVMPRNEKKNMVNVAAVASIVRDWQQSYRVQKAIVERVNAMPPRKGNACPVCKQSKGGMGAASAFNFGESFGVVHAVCTALSLPVHFVVPQKWKRAADLYGKDKSLALTKAQLLWPSADLRLKKHLGRAEALLIARYGHPDTTETKRHAANC